MKPDINKIIDYIKKPFSILGKIKIKRVKHPAVLTEQADLDKKLVFSLAKKRFPSWKQIQYLPQYLSGKERLIIRGLLILIIISLGFLVVRFYQRHILYLPQDGGNYVEALVGQPSYINPVLAQSDIDRDLTKLIYSGLFKYNENLEIEPDLADRYEISEDKKTYTIYLKPDILWHNGNSLLADDVLYTFEIIKDTEFNSPYASSFQGVELQRIDDHTISFTLPEPFAPFLSNLTVGILPGHIWNDVGPTNFRLAEYNTKPVGSGPYKFKELIKDREGTIKSYKIERNINYYSKQSYLDEISFKFYPDFESAINAINNNNVDGASYLPTNLKENLTHKKTTIHELQLPQYTAVFFNQKNSLFKNEDLNKALSLGTNKERILLEALQGQGIIVDAPILEGFLGYHPDIEKFNYDPTRAAAVLDEQGWKVPEDGGLRQKDGSILQFSLTTVDQSEYLKTAEILIENWEAINVGVELKIMNPSRVDKEVIKPRNYEAFLYGEILGSDPDPYAFWHSSQSLNGGLNLSSYFNKEVDTLLEAARQTDNIDERSQKYIEFQNLLIADMPAIFLYSPIYDYPVTEKLHGIDTKRISVPSDRFNGVEDWYSNTKLGWE
ncbi:MAG: ABC transporter substrate-binding protein [bacterium]|nr:ABC transporter substrate-binding protein [bacterium]